MSALFALLLQLALTFGHVHVAHAAGGDKPLAVAAAVPGAGQATGSGQPDGDHRHDDYCAICAVMTLLTVASPPVAPALSSPPDPTPAEIAIADAAVRVALEQVAFRSRAPPHS